MAGHGKHHHHNDHSDWVITNKMIVQDVLNACPQALAVFTKHLGPYALAVPGVKTEAIEVLAAMSDYHEEKLLEELNQVCKQKPKKTGHF